MKKHLLLVCGLLAGLMPAHAQIATVVASCPATRSTAYPAGTQALLTVDVNGNLCNSSSGGGGDASAANQLLQITQETLTNTILGAVTASPTANTIGDRLKVINTTLGTPMQASGGTVGISGTLPAFAATPTVNIGTAPTITVTGPLTDIQLRATAVPVSGTVAFSNSTIAVTNAGTFATQSAVTAASGAFASGSIGSGAMVDLGAIADAAATAGSTGSVSAKLRLLTSLVNTTNAILNNPFQAGGSIGNTSFAATQATASNLNATVVGTGTFATQSAITAAGGSMTDLGAIADAAATAGSTGTLSAKLRLMTTQLGTINTTLGTPMQATGGTVGLVAGSAIAGKFGIDQTTPGTTNLVAAGQSGTWTVQPGNTPNTSAWLFTAIPSGAATAGVAHSTSVTTAESCRVLKGSAGSIHSLRVSIGATSGYVMVFDATSAPGDGAVTTLAIPAVRVVSDGTSGWYADEFSPPLVNATGITVCFSTTGPFSKTASATAAISGQVQ